MSDEQGFRRPLFVLRNGKVVEDNVKEFLEWRKRTDPEAYRTAMRQLTERWLYRQRVARGMEHVFLRAGRRIMIDLPAYKAALRSGSHSEAMGRRQ
jgi:hypothetical protein